MSDYTRIEKAMTYLSEQVHRQPTLDEVAAHVHLSPFHFQRMFCQWSGTTPKRFLQALTLERGKRLLDEGSLIDVSHSVGLSGGSRLYDHFVKLEAVTPGEYKRGGESVEIHYGLHETLLGPVFIAVTPRGVCQIDFVDENGADEMLAKLHKKWPNGKLVGDKASTEYVAEALFARKTSERSGPLSLHVAGTNFQIAVWRALLRIPSGKLSSYSQIAKVLGSPKASRAVGNAIGANPIALLIPCHRVIQQSGALGGYRWGLSKKVMVQTWEQLR